mmetsp:Transcript_22898/g.41084  ORF Transcript_22898/g.41084 Transcript_22898/m.41084 type:complete len:283 (+) Transcript_22898:51-899(+)|eukprot:CAMPEP_0201873994 /NCGR_PEP_ID=MMETSP0902-20130614/6364_1 /ASSEMBLY_ACC=CAM_ASM_000551 /TAXON_ID=420261 /ORGANISM="Thalassiosira antarctica, Strain CCMP982" /LENGTH=282 /DNA_ID=CAMNT_0048400749 /DNA_START=65 /DNA_END=913 /DNA_ORIENTATION=+
MCILVDEALDQWNALAEREENIANKIQPPSSSEQQEGQEGQTHQRHPSIARKNKNIIHSCPTVWREKICEWCYQVVDHCNIDRDVVSIALSYFDRYLSLQTSIGDSVFQLVAMTSLYLAVKMHSTRKISVSSISSLSKGCFRVDQILKMEICIIKSLRWHLNPPTPSMYLNVVNPLFDISVIDPQASFEITELSRYLLELSVCDAYFIDKKPSSIAYAAISVAMEGLPTPAKMQRDFGLYQLDKSPHVTELCAQRLRHVYSLAVSTQTEDEDRGNLSPTSVI